MSFTQRYCAAQRHTAAGGELSDLYVTHDSLIDIFLRLMRDYFKTCHNYM